MNKLTLTLLLISAPSILAGDTSAECRYLYNRFLILQEDLDDLILRLDTGDYDERYTDESVRMFIDNTNKQLTYNRDQQTELECHKYPIRLFYRTYEN